MKVATVIGARPQFVKAAVVSRAFLGGDSCVQELIVHTGQHYDENMSDVFFHDLNIPAPKYNLGIGGGSHGKNTGRMLEAIESILKDESPDWVLVYGDTDSTIAGALAAAKMHIKVAHVEAGLRSFNRHMPEEINRILTDHAADLLFTPTTVATRNLIQEGISTNRIRQVGDVMFDATKYYASRARPLSQFDSVQNFVLATIHRAENTDSQDRLSQILSGLEQVASRIPVVLPLHPRTLQRISAFGLSARGLTVIDPVGYLEMLWLLDRCSCVVTDSGGLQKEAYFFSKPCITTRDETEWTELVEAGANTLVGADSKQLVAAVGSVLTNPPAQGLGSRELYGSGNCASSIVQALKEFKS